jgi:glutamine phosphoribosylpyrophosphate amidotransferase
MCGVIGYYTNNPSKEHVHNMQRLFLESKIRGLHAAGFAYSNLLKDSGYTVQRFLSIDETLISLKELANSGHIPNGMIGHTRYSTSGDFHKLENNQPLSVTLEGDFHIDGVRKKSTQQTVLAFNGVISMASKEEMEISISSKMQTDNDGELFLRRLFVNGEYPHDIIKHTGSFAGAWFDSPSSEIILLRNRHRPLYTYLSEDGGTLYWASTKDIFRRAFNSDIEVKQLLPLIPMKASYYLHVNQ